MVRGVARRMRLYHVQTSHREQISSRAKPQAHIRELLPVSSFIAGSRALTDRKLVEEHGEEHCNTKLTRILVHHRIQCELRSVEIWRLGSVLEILRVDRKVFEDGLHAGISGARI